MAHTIDFRGRKYQGGAQSPDRPFAALYWRYQSPMYDTYETLGEAVSIHASRDEYGESLTRGVINHLTGEVLVQFDDASAPGYFQFVSDANRAINGVVYPWDADDNG